MDRDVLEALSVQDLTARQIAAETGRSLTTVRYWLRRYGLATASARRRRTAAQAKIDGVPWLEFRCVHHGLTKHVRRRDGFRCAKCEKQRVSDARRRMKRRLVEEAGGACVLCGYARCLGALQFHHVDPTTKSFHVSREGVTRSIAAARAEAQKCVLLCANCHAEVEAGYVALPLRPPP